MREKGSLGDDIFGEQSPENINVAHNPPNSPTESPTETAPRLQRIKVAGLIIGAMVVGPAVGVGGAALLTEHRLDNRQSEEPEQLGDKQPTAIEPTSDETLPPLRVNDILQSNGHPSAQLIDSFEGDIALDYCDDQSVAVNAAQIYHNVFEAIDYENITDQELELAIENIDQRLSEQRQNLELTPLPAIYPELLADLRSGNPSLPLEDYQLALDTMLQQVGVEAVYDWSASINPDLEAPTTAEAIPLEDPEQSDSLRQAIVGSMEAFAMMPNEIINSLSASNKIYFGDITYLSDTISDDSYIAGLALPSVSTSQIVIDATYYDNYNGLYIYRSTVTHEVAHTIKFNACYNILDLVWRAQYPSDYTPMQQGDEYITLDTLTEDVDPEADDVVVAVSKYGASSYIESYATLIGETIFEPTYANDLFIAPDNSQILYRQLALTLGRYGQVNPDLAAYFENQLLAAALEQTATDRADETLVPWYDYLNNLDDTAEFDETGTIIIPDELQAIYNQGGYYRDLADLANGSQLDLLDNVLPATKIISRK